MADEKTENINRAVQSNRRFTVKICGPGREVLAALKAIPGVIYAELMPERDGDACIYTLESEVGTDVRKRLFTTLAEKNWPMVGLETVGMSLEDIFITIVDDSVDITNAKDMKGGRRKYDYESRRAEESKELARRIRANAEANNSENAEADR